MAGNTEKRRKILSICKLVNACPPNKLPQIPPTAIDNQVMDCRSPANDALSDLTASAIIASTTTSAMAEPRLCTVKRTVRCHWELLKLESMPSIGQGTRERRVAITRYGILFLPFIGMQSDKIPYNGFMLHGKNAIEDTNCEADGDSLRLSFS